MSVSTKAFNDPRSKYPSLGSLIDKYLLLTILTGLWGTIRAKSISQIRHGWTDKGLLSTDLIIHDERPSNLHWPYELSALSHFYFCPLEYASRSRDRLFLSKPFLSKPALWPQEELHLPDGLTSTRDLHPCRLVVSYSSLIIGCVFVSIPVVNPFHNSSDILGNNTAM